MDSLGRPCSIGDIVRAGRRQQAVNNVLARRQFVLELVSEKFLINFAKDAVLIRLSHFNSMKRECHVGQKLESGEAGLEAERLLKMALVLLDDTENFATSVYVLQALSVLSSEHHGRSLLGHSDLDIDAHFQPSWGILVDRQAAGR
ncbi:MAG: hypothetical protein B7Z37_21025 [Verrucomicrobia bacterium 12-59-8]|nr:MAG: hypothetical protein B7Z37_21025 [Verrucomicrobia bacterium 12-59-8]